MQMSYGIDAVEFIVLILILYNINKTVKVSLEKIHKELEDLHRTMKRTGLHPCRETA